MAVTDRINGLLGSVAIKPPCRVATTANITLSGLQTIDGVTVVAGDRVLVKDQTTASENGIYEANTSAWTRAKDFNGNRDVVNGTFLLVTDGTTNGESLWKVTTANPITIGSSSISFENTLGSGLGASLVGLTQGGTVQEALAFVTPEMYSSYSAADPSDAIQWALDSGRTVITMQTEYEITKKITIPSNAKWHCHGTTIKRKTGSGVFDMLENEDTVGGNSGIEIYGLRINGNKDADGLVATNASDRFSGLSLKNVTDSKIDVNVMYTVNGEVQAEGTRAGVCLQDCSNIDAWLDGSYNDRTAVYIARSAVRVLRSYTHNNDGSGISGTQMDDSEFYNIHSHDNGYSNVSINGLRCKGNNIRSYNGASGYACVNIGHNSAGNAADGTILHNVHVYDGAGWGVTIVGSADVQINGLRAYGCANYNVRVFDSATRSRIDGCESSGGDLIGISYESGTGHYLDNAEVKQNGTYGIYAGTGVGLTTGPGVKSYNNGRVTSANSGGLVSVSADIVVHGGEYFDDQGGSATQEAGIWVSGGSAELNRPYVPTNKTYNLRTSSSPTMIRNEIRIGNDVHLDTFTATGASATYTVNNDNVRDTQKVRVWPRNAAAVTLGVPYVSAAVAGTSFTVTFPGAAAGTELYSYEIL